MPAPPARGDAKGVEPGPDEQVPLFRRLAQDEVAIRREAFRPVDQLLDPGGFQRRHPADGQVHELPEMIEVRGQKLEVEPFGNALHRPGHRVRLVSAPDKTADLFLPVGQPVGVAQGGQVRRHAGDPFGHHVLMFHRHQRHVDAHRRRQGPRPLPGADHHLFAVYPALRRLHPPDAPLFHDDPGDRRILKYPHPRHARAACQRLGDIRRVCLPVGRQKGRAHQIVNGHQRPQVLRLLRGQQMHLKPKGMRGRCLPLHFRPAFGSAGQPQPAVHLPPGLQAGFLFQPPVEVHRIAQQLRDVGRGAQLPHQPRRMKGGPRGQLLAFQQNRIGPAQLAQMIGRGTADDPATDDHRFCRCWKLCHRILSFG